LEEIELLLLNKILIVSLSVGLPTSACSGSVTGPASSDTDSGKASERMGNIVSDTNLPVNKRFRTLDQYLAYLEQTQGPVDGPWYKEVSPGMYQLQTGGNLHLDVPADAKEKRLFTRQELEKKFGFSK
jgi:hypothetical protein